MKQIIFGSAFAGLLAVGAGVSAQSPAMANSQARTPEVTSADQQERQVTIEGCIAREQDVAGREPGFMERMGIGIDYILTDVSPSGSAASADAATAPDSDASASAASSAAADASAAETPRADEEADVSARSSGADTSAGEQGALYELEGVDEDELQRHVGQRVVIQGTLEDVDDIDVAGDDLPELNVESIRAATSGESCAK